MSLQTKNDGVDFRVYLHLDLMHFSNNLKLHAVTSLSDVRPRLSLDHTCALILFNRNNRTQPQLNMA